jgi:two-component sensor histidine kinase
VYPQTSAFGVYQNIPGEKNSLQSDVTMASFKDDKENIWVGTSKGLECIDQATGNVTQYQFIDPHLKDQWQYFVMPIFQQDASSFWVGTWGAGMQLFDFKKRKFIASYAHFSNSPLSISSNFIHAFCKDSRGNLWITTWNGGVDRFDPRKHIFEHFTTTNKKINFDYLNKICFAYNTIWAGNREGLVKYDSLTNKFHLFRITNDSTNIFSSAVGEITPDGKGNLWIGSFKGLIKFDCNTNRFKKIEAVGNSEVSGVLIESESEIWLTTSEGVKLYNPVTEKLTTYSLKDGLPISYFAGEFYSYKAPDGEIFLSSNNGLIHFRPENIRRNDSKPSLFITSVKIENKELEGLGDVNQLRYLKLNYNQNYLTLGFAAMNFINPGQNKYAYKLEGVDNEWVFSGNRNEAIYTNLSPGDYVFRIKGSNDAGIWNEEGVTLNIHINTPWWRTWWFYGLCFITVMAIGYSLYRIRISRIIGEQKLRNKIARDLHDDIGSTLSGIKLFSSMAQNKLMQENSEALNIVERITERSEKMIDAMSDIVWSINPVNDSIENMFVRMKQHAAEMFEPRNISFRFNSEESITKMKIPLEIRKDIYLIFKESINNAVKHANCKNVFINLDIQQKNFKMTIIDDGIGFDIKELNCKGNGLGNFSERAKNIGGKINISSMPGKGTNVELVVLVT